MLKKEVEAQENNLLNDPLAQTAIFQSFPNENNSVQGEGKSLTHIRKLEPKESFENEPTNMGNYFSFNLNRVQMPPVEGNNTLQNKDIINNKGLEQEIKEKNASSTGSNKTDFITNNTLENKGLDFYSNLNNNNNNEENKFENNMGNNVILPEFGGIGAQGISEFPSTNAKMENKQTNSNGQTNPPLFEGNLTSTRIEPISPEIDSLNNNKVPPFETRENNYEAPPFESKINNYQIPSFESSANVGEYLGLDIDNNSTQYDDIFNLIEQSDKKQPSLETNNLMTYTNGQVQSDNNELYAKKIIDKILSDLPPLNTNDILNYVDQQIPNNNTQLVNQIPINNLTSHQSQPYPLPINNIINTNTTYESKPIQNINTSINIPQAITSTPPSQESQPYPLPINNVINTSTTYESKPIQNINTSINIPQALTSTSPSQEFLSNSYSQINSSLPITQANFQTFPPNDYLSESVQEIKTQAPLPLTENNQNNNLLFEIKSAPQIPLDNIPIGTSFYPTENHIENIYSSQSNPLVDIPAKTQITTFPKTVIPLEKQNQNIYIPPFPQTEITQYTTENPITNFSNNILPLESQNQNIYIPPPPAPIDLNTQASYVPFPIIGAPTDISSFGYDNQSNYLSQAQPYPITLPENQVNTTNILPYETQSQNINILEGSQANPNFNYAQAQPPYSTYPTTQSTNMPNNMRTETEIVPVEEIQYIPVKKVKYVKKTKVFVPTVKKVIVPVKKKVIIPVRKTIYVPKKIEIPIGSPTQSENSLMPNYSQTEPQTPPNYSSMSNQINIYNSNNLPYSTNSSHTEIDNEIEEHAIPLYEREEPKAQIGSPMQSFAAMNTSLYFGELPPQTGLSPAISTSPRNSIIHTGKLYSPTTYRARSLFNRSKFN